jgi:hypothetical protein
LHRNVDLASQLLLRRHRSSPQLRQQATCLVTTDLAQGAGKANQIVFAEATALHQLTEARQSARVADATEDVNGGSPRMVIVEQRQEPPQRHVGMPLAECASHLDEKRVPVVEARLWPKGRRQGIERLDDLISGARHF